jgi:hypothetical protein
LDREYLEDYKQKEYAHYEELLKDIQKDKFSFEKDSYPPDERFVKLKEPVARSSFMPAMHKNLWAQVPFCGSLLLLLDPIPKPLFEEIYFKASEIPEIIGFIKETGKLQIALSGRVLGYAGLDHFDEIFEELDPPVYFMAPLSLFGNKKEVQKAEDIFYTLAKVRYFDYLRELSSVAGTQSFSIMVDRFASAYTILKLGHYSIVEDIENLLIDDPTLAFALMIICRDFIVDPITDLRSDLANLTLEDIKRAHALPLVYQSEDMRFPAEIGKFLLRKLTYAPQTLRACYDLIDHYADYDLQKIQESLNEAIVANHPDIVSKSADDLSEILDNVWNDPTIPRQIKNLKRGLPISIAAIGSAVSAFTGGFGGFLAGLGFSVGAKFLDVEIKGLSERLVKFFARSYQANVYDFKKKYKNRIAK